MNKAELVAERKRVAQEVLERLGDNMITPMVSGIFYSNGNQECTACAVGAALAVVVPREEWGYASGRVRPLLGRLWAPREVDAIEYAYQWYTGCYAFLGSNRLQPAEAEDLRAFLPDPEFNEEEDTHAYEQEVLKERMEAVWTRILESVNGSLLADEPSGTLLEDK